RPPDRRVAPDGREYRHLTVAFSRGDRLATLTVRGPEAPPPEIVDDMTALGAAFWPLALARALDDAILDIRLNEPDIAAIVLKSQGDGAAGFAYYDLLQVKREPWPSRGIRPKWEDGPKRPALTPRRPIARV